MIFFFWADEVILCNPIILIPLAGSCGLLLLLILIIVVHCNRKSLLNMSKT